MLIMMLHKIMRLWPSVLLGLLMFYFSQQCDARAVNVSNTWTMPPEGLNVFYRFFRDRISWFEADAVCQFHHANLVTVDNSFQFDATRDLLRELDVNDIVWIGLMRPQNSERFMWSNSHPLVADTGYWAESLPLMDSPLCAVIDPIRDYRWHALRCGGPETASFLCEMPVPSWADICIIKDMPNLTMQYMADTASIELIRNCQEEGLLRHSCKGKADREQAMQELICPKERLEAQRINEITNSHFKSLQIINSIRSDNNENNNIDLLPMEPNYAPQEQPGFMEQQMPTEKNTVQRLIETFNVDELMQADAPYKIPDEIPKPVKKTAKKVSNAKKQKQQKTDTAIRQAEQQQQAQLNAEAMLKQQQKRAKILIMDDMMFGDQPLGEPEFLDHVISDEVSNEIMQPLPHQKKILPTDLRTMPSITEHIDDHAKDVHTKPTTTSTTTSTALPPISSTTLVVTNSATTEANAALPMTTEQQHGTGYASDAHSSTLLHVQPTATIGHPMHPQQPRSNVITEATQHPHIKESADNSHFIPPMLMVKSHYVPQSKHGSAEHTANEHHTTHVPAMHATSTTTTATIMPTTDRVLSVENGESAVAASVTMATATSAPVADANNTHAMPVTGTTLDAATTTTTRATILKPITGNAGEQEQQEMRRGEGEKLHASKDDEDTTTATNEQKIATIVAVDETASPTVAATTAKAAADTATVTENVTEQKLSKRHDVLAAEATTKSAIHRNEHIEAITATTTQATQETTTTQRTIMEATGDSERQTKIATATNDANSGEQTDYRMPAEAAEATRVTDIATTTTATIVTSVNAVKKIEDDNSGNGNEGKPNMEQGDDDDDNTQETIVVRTTNVPATVTTTTTTTTTITTAAPTKLANTEMPTTMSNANTRTATTEKATASENTEATTMKTFVTAAPIVTTTKSATTAETNEPITSTTHDFLKDMEEEDNLDAESYRPNRRRALTKPETASYLKKILG